MSNFNKSYRIRTEVGKNANIHVNLDRDYDVLEIMSLKINQENAYKLHSSNYGVIAGRVLANEAMGIPNAKVSVFINIDENDANDVVKSVLYPYNTTISKDKNGVRYNLLPNEVISDCHTVIGTFPSKQYLLDNDDVLEIFEKYYKYTTRTNNAGDFMIFGVPTGSQTVHVDIDLSDIGILSQKPRDMVYKGYNIEQFENPNKFKYDTNIDSLTQVISQDTVIDVIPFWGDKNETSTIGISRCDVNIQYKFEPTCVFIGSLVSDSRSNGISKKCIPTPGTGSMEDITTGSGTIEMIRKTPFGDVEEFQIKGTQLIDGNGVWCYQIPMNLDYMMTDEYGNMVPTNNPDKGVPTRTRVRFRISMQDFENDNSNMFRCKMLVPHNPNIYSSNCDNELDYSFGTKTKDSSYRDLFWNGVYSVKSFIPRIQKGSNWKNEKFTGFKRINYHGDKNPIPYNNIRIKIPFMYTIMCVIIKGILKMVSLLNWVFLICRKSFVKQDDDNSGGFISISGDLCSDNLDTLCIIPGVKIDRLTGDVNRKKSTLLGMALLKHYSELGGDLSDMPSLKEDTQSTNDEKSIDYDNSNNEKKAGENSVSGVITDGDGKEKTNARVNVAIQGVRVTDKLDYLIHCIEMNLAHEYKVIQFDFYNDWINGMIYIPRWMRTITKKRSFLWGLIKFGGKVKACNEEYKSGNRNIVQQCGLDYNFSIGNNGSVTYNVQNNFGCKNNSKLRCHKASSVRKKYPIFKNNGVVKSFQIESTKQYVYYFKPYENSGKNVRLFATDIILLGTLNSCDKFGIENNLTELVSSTYQMPPNLALTDSDIEGNDYESNNSNDYIKMTVRENKGLVTDINLGNCYTGINPMSEYGSYTELSGIDWGYSGPLQTHNGGTISKFFKPGGHFLGISCRNSETNIKTCVNLSRICEHGVWMSQRHELLIPKADTPSSQSDAFLKYATVPSGLITKDEISGTDYRRMFASMNKNRLNTKVNENGILEYDFLYVNPTNFSGDLNEKVSNENDVFNRWITGSVIEQQVNYTDDDYYKPTVEKTRTENEQQIMRTGEYSDSEYLKYRFGFTDNTIKDSNERNSRFLISSGNVSFPMYDNSFYFYFGLYDGKTALDEFKKTYYSVCEKNNDLNIIDNGIELSGLTTTYDGICDTSGKGTLKFILKTVQSFFEDKENSLSVKLKNSNGITVEEIGKITVNNVEITFKNLKYGEYTIEVSSSNDKLNDSFYIDINRINVTASVNAKPFIRTYSDADAGCTIFSKYNDNRDEIGGYITIDGDSINYENNGVIKSINIFNGGIVSKIEVTYLEENKDSDGNVTGYTETGTIIQGDFSNGKITKLKYNDCEVNVIKSIINNGDPIIYGDSIIPVPFGDVTYIVYVTTIMEDCKVKETASQTITNGTSMYKWQLGSVFVKKAIPISVFYGNTDIEIIKSYFINNNVNDNVTTINGWWTRFQEEDEAVKWNLKKMLYASDFPHKVTITIGGGTKPTEHKLISGMTETIDKETGEFLGLNSDVSSLDSTNVVSALGNVNIPTLNWTDSDRRYHFAYRAIDVNKQQYPDEPFIIPIIYKPFFTELCLFKISHLNKYILYGYTYNGLTWVGEGFNDVRLNNEQIYDFISPNDLEDDGTMKLDEIISGDTITSRDGLGYTGEYCKYNGRKGKVNKELEELRHNLNSGNLKLYIGNLHVETSDKDGSEIASYSNSTEINVSGVTFDNFIKEEKITRVNKALYINKIYIKPIKKTTISSNVIEVEYQAYAYFNVKSRITITAKTKDYPKPGIIDDTISLTIEPGERASNEGNTVTLRHYDFLSDRSIDEDTIILNIIEDDEQVYEGILYTDGANEDGYIHDNYGEYEKGETYRTVTKCLVKIEHEKNNDLYNTKPIIDYNYPYPVNGENVDINDKLFKGVIEDSLNAYTITNSGGFIDINNLDKTFRDRIKKLYYVSTPENLSTTKKSINYNCLKTANISEAIDLETYYDFYPLDLHITGEDRKVGSGIDSYYETTLTIRSRYDEKSRKNFKNKKYSITFYKKLNNNEYKTKTFEFETKKDQEEYIETIKDNARTEMGINFNSLSNKDDLISLRYEYTVSYTDGSFTRTYGNTVEEGNDIKYNAIIRYIDK